MASKGLQCTLNGKPIRVKTTLPLIVLLTLVIIFIASKKCRKEGFSQRAKEVCQESRELFEKEGNNATYSEYKTSVAGADPVLYTDVRALWKKGKLTPERVQRVL